MMSFTLFAELFYSSGSYSDNKLPTECYEETMRLMEITREIFDGRTEDPITALMRRSNVSLKRSGISFHVIINLSHDAVVFRGLISALGCFVYHKRESKRRRNYYETDLDIVISL
jgi:hypothetical protein